MDIFVLFLKKSVEQHYSFRQLQKKRVRTCISVQIKPVPPGTLRDVHDGALKKTVGGNSSAEGRLMEHVLYLKGNLKDCTT